MSSDIIVIASIAVPAIVLLVLKSNAALTFLSLCVGSVLAQVAATDANQVLGVASSAPVNNVNTISLALLLLPAVMTAIFMIKTVKPRHIVLQILPAIGFGAAALVLAQPYLPATVATQLAQSPVWSKIDGLSVIIIGLSSLICLLVVWVQRPKRPKPEEAHHH